MLPNVLQPGATDHVPVLADEVRQLLAIEPGETVVDATFGAGGHAALLASDLRGKGRLMQRYFFSGAAEAEVDKQGRVMVPSPLGDYAGLGKEVVVAGIRDHLEIWDRASWRAYLDEIEGSAEDVAERLATRRD